MVRIGNTGMAAFACLFMQSPSFFAFQRMLEDRCGDSNARTLFGMERIPYDNHIRQTLDDVPPEPFEDVFIPWSATSTARAPSAACVASGTGP